MRSDRIQFSWALVASKVSILALVLCALEFGLPQHPSTGFILNDIAGEVYAQSDRLEKKRGGKQKRRKKKSDEDGERREYPNLRQETYDKLARIEKVFDEDEDTEKALKLIADMLRRPKNYNGHEIAQVHALAGRISWETDDMEKTKEHYHAILVDREVIPEALEQRMLWNLAQLYFQDGEFDRTLELINEWLTLVESPTARSYYFMAIVYTRKEDWERTESYTDIAIKMEQDAGKKIPKGWWDLLLLAFYEQGKLSDCVGVLETLVQVYPSSRYWKQLSSFYYETGHVDKQLGALEAAHAGGYFEQEEDGRSLTQFASVLMVDGAYYRAAKYFEEGFENEKVPGEFRNLQLLAQAHMMSLDRKKAIEVYEIAAPDAPNGAVFERLARLYLNTEEYAKCIEAVEGAFEKGGLGRPHQAELLRGTCYVEMKDLQSARKSFKEALRSARKEKEASGVESANKWLTFVHNEEQRLEFLEDLKRR